ETGEERRLTNEKERDVAGFFWKGNDRVIFMKDSGGDENYHIWIVSVSGNDPRDLTPFPKVKASVVDDLEEDEGHVLIQMNERDERVFDVYRCVIATGELSLIAENPGNIVGWMTDHDGKLRVAVETDGVNESILYRADENADFEKILTINFKDTFSPLMFSYDNKLLYVASNLDAPDGSARDKCAIYTYDPKERRILDLIYEHPEVDVSRLTSSKKRKIITGVIFTTDKSRYHFFDADRKNLQDELEKRLPGSEVALSDMDDDENRYIVVEYDDLSRGRYHFYDRASGRFELLADLSPWIKKGNMSPMKPIKFESRDGVTINGYLTLPSGIEPTKLPVIVNPHGGPSVRDRWGYDSEAQFLANRGAAVLHVNFRGSTGYGKEFWQAGFKQWGRRMQDDVSDGVKWLIKEGIADPERVAIYGGSYGGYAALAGMTFTPELYACGISYVGPSNIFTLLESIPPYWEPMREMQYETIGDPVKDKELLTQVSPLFHADRINAPLFVAQGANDPRVKKAESDQIVDAVRKHGKDVVYMVKDNEGHGFHNEENRFDFYREMEKFLAEHLGLRSEKLEK
ncbi:MAG: S9 family peptidase, partial [Synergistaceae bacterium]|nr:S9 family peptidase [Synergistaceae bacterium]